MNCHTWCEHATQRRILTTVTGPVSRLQCPCVTVPRQCHSCGFLTCLPVLPNFPTFVRPLSSVFATAQAAPETAKVPGIAYQRLTDTSSTETFATLGLGLLNTSMVANANNSMTRMVMRNSSRSERGASLHIQRRYCTIGRSVKGGWLRVRPAALRHSARRTPS